MPIPVINYSAQQPQGYPLAQGLVPALKQGIALGYLPTEMQRATQKFGSDQERSKLENALMQIGLQNAPQNHDQATRIYEQDLLAKQLANQYYPRNMESQIDFMGHQSQGLQFENALKAAELKRGPQFMPNSPIGKLIIDRDQLTSLYGSEDPRVKELDLNIANTNMNKSGAVNPAGVMIDPSSGVPLVNIGGASGGGRYGASGATYLNPLTGEITSFPTGTAKSRDIKTISGAENVKSYVNSILSQSIDIPLLTTATGVGKVLSQKAINSLIPYSEKFGLDAPSKQALLESKVKSFAEGFINQFGLNATNENVNKAEAIIRPHFGESTKGYMKRIEEQLKDFADIQQRAESRLGGGISLGYIGGNGNKMNPEEFSNIPGINPSTLNLIKQIQSGNYNKENTISGMKKLPQPQAHIDALQKSLETPVKKKNLTYNPVTKEWK